MAGRRDLHTDLRTCTTYRVDLRGKNSIVLVRTIFEKTGYLITADMSHDHKISPQGLENYQV